MGFDNFKHFSFLIQEEILFEFKMRLQLARLQGGLIHGLQCRPGLGYKINDIKRLKIPYDVPPSMHYSKIKYWRSFLISLLPSSH